ncbi:uncharacterized protein LOC118282435 [Spodoptera frugiperda]|uniref:Uncharacterized protein LOC118282435 n=2 Tax=Spodoptera frugiperda TaxID=7108 RepID=A0A9R0E1I0_SPOFR|nr:uncharacterized protein LOC118282435 [Spodoptera frugiperda]
MNSFLQSLENPARPFLGPNYWILKKMGLLLPKSKLGTILYIFLHETVTFFVVTQYMELYVIRSDLDLVLTNMKISMLSVVCIVKVNTFVLWQKHWREVLDYITEADNFERQSEDPGKIQIVEAYTKYCRRLTYFYWVLVSTTFLTTTCSPLMRYLSSSTFRENMRNGTEQFPHIFSSWMPFDKYHSPGCWITVLWHTVLCAYGAAIMAAYDTCIVVTMVFFGGKLDLLRERCKHMFGSYGTVITDKQCEEVVRQLHGIHIMLIKYSRLFNSLLSPVMFFYMVMCSLMLCASAYQLTSAQNAAQKLLMAEYLIFGIAQLFVFCWHSNDVLIKNENMTSGPFESNWYTANCRQKKDVLLLSGHIVVLLCQRRVAMENQNLPERVVPVQYGRGSRAFRQFKNPPQPHMCIQDTIKGTSEKLYINVLGWQKIANPKQYSDPIPLYGGMQVPQNYGPNAGRPPMIVFAVMVNPDILKANGKNASSPTDREALVSLLCDFVEAMNPGLVLARNPVIMKDRDLAGELKDVWLAVQNKREREKGMNQDVMYKVYDIDGIGEDNMNEDDVQTKQGGSPNRGSNGDKKPVKSSKQILLNAGQKSEFDSGMNNCQLNQTHANRDNKTGNSSPDTTYCTPVYGQIVSTRENHNQINDIQQKFSSNEIKPSSSFRKDWNPMHGKTTEGWDEFSKRNISTIKSDDKKRCIKDKSKISNGKSHYDFFPYFDNKSANEAEGSEEEDSMNKEQITNEENSKIIIDPMQKLVLHSTDKNICDNNTSALSSISS